MRSGFALAPRLSPGDLEQDMDLPDQKEVQLLLDAEAKRSGFPAALECLFARSLRAGYFHEGVFDANDLFTFADRDTGVEFRVQINRSRVGYQAPAETRPVCPICFSEVDSPAKPLLRAWEFALGEKNTPFFIQLTPFPLRRRHYILIQKAHEPMRVTRQSVDELLDFLQLAPGFTACSNSDVAGAGVSILAHHHYQVFADYELPVTRAQAVPELTGTVGDSQLELLHYPLSALRVRGGREAVTGAAGGIISGWRSLAPRRNTCNLTARRTAEGRFEIYLFFRNPRHLTPSQLLRIKSEGVGVVEASGEAIFPPPDQATFQEIRRDGLQIVTGILSGLDPVKPEGRRELFENCLEWASRFSPVPGSRG